MNSGGRHSSNSFTGPTYFIPPDLPKDQLPQSRCPKCTLPRPTLAHCIRHCPVVAKFWTKVHKYIGEVPQTVIILCPLLFVFSVQTKGPRPAHDHPRFVPVWAHICVLAARWCIMKCWARRVPPSLTDLRASLHDLFLLEKLEVKLHPHKNSKLFYKRWTRYNKYSYPSDAVSSKSSPCVDGFLGIVGTAT